MKQSIAIIGGGMAGLTAGYLLHGNYDITLFEKSERIGGNAYTLAGPDGEEVDIAACAFGKYSYKNLFKLFSKLKIETAAPAEKGPFGRFGLDISFYNLDSKKGVYMTPGINGLISQRFQLLRPGNIKSMIGFARGLKKAMSLFEKGHLDGMTIQEVLRNIPSFRGDAELFFLGMLCLISSMHCDAVLDAPAGFFFEKFKIHGEFLPPKSLFSVHFVKNRTRSYVDALASGYRDRMILNAAIATVVRRDNKVTVVMADGRTLLFDKVVFACNADQALQLLAEPTKDEKRLLAAWQYTEGKVTVHSDHSRFPKRELMRGYVFLYQNKGRYMETSISGALCALPGVSDNNALIGTQHPNFPIDPSHIVFEKVFRTPIFDFRSCSTVRELPSLNGKNNTYYCGSHFGVGNHEDAVTSAMEAARKLGVDF